MRTTVSTALLVFYVVVILAMLLAPLDFHTRNGATWLRDADGIAFASTGIIRTGTAPGRLYTDLTSGRGFTAEVWLSSQAEHQTGPARILSYSAGTSTRNFTIGQSGPTLIVRLRTSRTGDNGVPDLEVHDVLAAGVTRHVVVTYDLRLLCVYVDGRRRVCSESPGGTLGTWDPSHELLLGNEATGNRPWLGTIYLVALYNHVLSEDTIGRAHTTASATTQGLVALYTFDERSGRTVADSGPRPPVPLTIPSVVESVSPLLSPEIALLSWPLTRATILDAAINLLLFIPFGLLGCIVLVARGRKPLQAAAIMIVVTAGFSIGVESLQYLLISRSSERQDVILNTISGGMGAALYWALPGYTRSRKRVRSSDVGRRHDSSRPNHR